MLLLGIRHFGTNEISYSAPKRIFSRFLIVDRALNDVTTFSLFGELVSYLSRVAYGLSNFVDFDKIKDIVVICG